MEDDILRAWVEEKKWRHIFEKDQVSTSSCSDVLVLTVTAQDGHSCGPIFCFLLRSPHRFCAVSISSISCTDPLSRTFKYVPSSSTLDARRAPAYTDRILWATPSSLSPPPITTSNEYTSHPILWSDHQPVSLSASVGVRVMDDIKRAQVLAESQKGLDKLEEVYRPGLSVSSTSIEFGELRSVWP